MNQPQDTYLTGPECAELLQIRPMRVAQLMRAGLLAFLSTVDGPIVHRRELKRMANDLAELLLILRVEKEVDESVEYGELVFECHSFPSESTARLLASVQVREPTFPRGAPVRRNQRYPQKLSPQE